MYGITSATLKIKNLQKRIRCVQGGTSASKTVSIILLLIDAAQRDTKPTLTSIVSETFPHLKRGAMRDFLSVMETHKYFKTARWNKTDCIYTFETGSKIEFFSADQPGKVRGPRRDRLFINEANNVPYEIFDQLEVRTNEYIFIDWNPVNEYWFYDKVANRTDVEHIIVTYRDNEALPETIRSSIEQRRERKDWWKVYGEGQLGEIEGKIYRDWQTIDEIPHFARLERYGLDFGYTNDPTSIVAIYYSNGGYIWDEVCFQKGLSNKQIADVILNQSQPQILTVADSAEPKSIDEMKVFGVNIVGAEKGADSVRNGIQIVQAQRISVTKRSVNIIQEYRNFLWQVDKNGVVLNVPEHLFSHSMDAGRYGMTSILKTPVFKMPEATPALAVHYPELGI